MSCEGKFSRKVTLQLSPKGFSTKYSKNGCWQCCQQISKFTARSYHSLPNIITPCSQLSFHRIPVNIEAYRRIERFGTNRYKMFKMETHYLKIKIFTRIRLIFFFVFFLSALKQTYRLISLHPIPLYCQFPGDFQQPFLKCF